MFGNFVSRSSKVAAGEVKQLNLAEKHVPGDLSNFVQSKTLGTGSFGRVRLAKYRPNNILDLNGKSMYFAIKMLNKCFIMKQRQVEHVKSEITLLASISHPFIVSLVNNFVDEKNIYMVFEYVQGGELFTHLRNTGRLSDDAARFYAAQIALCFSHLHQKNIAYRDLKPENVLITTTGFLKLTDFGFAKVILDRSWTLCGTPDYLAPELVTGQGHGVGVDWWAFGVLIYEMLAGIPPFYDNNHVRIYQKILALDLKYPNYFEPKATNLMKKLLQPDISKRAGCLKSGAQGVRRASWFSKSSFQDILQMKEEPPYVPRVLGDSDTSNFDEYPEEDAEHDTSAFEQGLRQNTSTNIFAADPFEDFDSVGFGILNKLNISPSPTKQDELVPLVDSNLKNDTPQTSNKN